MSLQTQFTAPSIARSEDWLSEEKISANSNNRPVASRAHMKVLKPAVSVTLLVGVILLVGFYYGTAEISDDIRALSVGALGAVLFALFANALAAVLRFKVIAGEIEHPVAFRQAMAIVSAGSLVGAVFFQIAGSINTTGGLSGRGGNPFAAFFGNNAY